MRETRGIKTSEKFVCNDCSLLYYKVVQTNTSFEVPLRMDLAEKIDIVKKC